MDTQKIHELLLLGKDEGSMARVVCKLFSFGYYYYDGRWYIDGEESIEMCVFGIVENVVYTAHGCSSVESVNNVIKIVQALSLSSY